MNDTCLLALGAMASELGVSARSLRAEAVAGRIPFVKVGETSLLFDPAAVRPVLLERSKEAERGRKGAESEGRDDA